MKFTNSSYQTLSFMDQSVLQRRLIYQFCSNNLRNMSSSYLKEPILTKKTTVRSENTFTATSIQMQGWRRKMEDALICEQLDEDLTLFAVCDGHGGPQVANLVAKLLPTMLKQDPDFIKSNYSQSFISVFRKLDELISSQKGQEQLKNFHKALYGRTLGVTDKIGYRAGTTCLALLLTKDKYIVANVGDSRAVLSRNRIAVPLSTDHKPNLPEEKARIEKAGGFVCKGRVNNSLNMSRCLGDFELKRMSSKPYDKQAIIGVPEVMEVDRSEEDNFLLLGCDGVWERYENSNQKMVDHLSRSKSHCSGKELMEGLLDELVAKDKKGLYGFDNMSGIILEF